MNKNRGSSKGVEYDFTGIHNLVKSLGNTLTVRVGVMGKKSTRQMVETKKLGNWQTHAKAGFTDKHLTNADIGAMHEFGVISKRIPARSWLRMPIHQKASEIVAYTKAGAVKIMAKTGSIEGVLKRMGIAAENAIQQAFASRGFGSWAPNSPRTIRAKGSTSPLIDTAQLRRAVTSQVMSK